MEKVRRNTEVVIDIREKGILVPGRAEKVHWMVSRYVIGAIDIGLSTEEMEDDICDHFSRRNVQVNIRLQTNGTFTVAYVTLALR